MSAVPNKAASSVKLERMKGNGGKACHDHADEVQLQDE